MDSELDFRAEDLDPGSDLNEGSIAHDTFSESWGGITDVRRFECGSAAPNMGASYDNEAQAPVDSAALTELLESDEGQSRLERAMKLLYPKNAERGRCLWRL